MTPTIQPGMHPDAESLTAFAEQLLPAAEREQILAHMTTCDRCREVVFLAQKAAGDDEPEMVPIYANEPIKPGRRWFTGWRWTWVPVTALAGIVGLAIVQHFRHPAQPEPQTTANLAPMDSLRKTERATPTAPVSSSSTEPVKQAKEQTLASPRKITPREAQKDAAELFDEKEPVKERDEALGGAAGAMGTMGALPSGSTHGMAIARAKSQSLGGPMANQFQQNANQLAQQNLTQQNAAPAPQNGPALSSDKPVTTNAAVGSVTQTVTVQAEPQIAQSAPTTPASPMTLSLAENETLEVKGRQIAGMKKMAKISLPSGAGVLSSASAAGRTIALDTAGALFVREDSQKRWQPVPAQWTGRAVLVRTPQTPGAAQPAPIFAIVQNPRFELVTDKLQTWVSVDGKMWTAAPISAK